MAFVPLSLSTIKKSTSPLIFQLNEPFLKFLQQCFLEKTLGYMPPGYNLQPMQLGLRGGRGCHPQRHNFCFFQLH